MPMAIGTAITSAKTELSTVTRKRSAMPNRRLSGSVVTNSELVMKLALLACSDGIARMIRKSAIRAIAPMIVAPAAIAIDLKTRSPHRPSPAFSPELLPGLVGIVGVSPTCCGLAAMSTSPQQSDRVSPSSLNYLAT